MGAFFFGKDGNMTVQKLYVKNKYFGDGANTVFPITFEWAKKHPESIQVWVRNNAGVLTKTDNFWLKTSSNEDIWNVVYPSVGDPLGQGETITIVRELSLLQVLNLVNQGPFFAEDVEITFDELVMMIQQLNEKLARSFKVAVDIDGENTFDTTVPIEPGKSFRVKDDGTGFEVTEDPAQVLPLAKSELEAVKREHAEAVQDLTVIKDEVESAKTDAQNAAQRAYDEGKELIEQDVLNAQASANSAEQAANTSVQQANIATNKASEISANASLLHQLKTYVTPEMFGAVGNGINDDSVAVQQAINSANVVVCQNRYAVRNIYVKDNTQLIGGGEFIALNYNESASIADADKCLYVENADNVIIKGLQFIGKGTFKEGSNLIQVRGTDKLTIEDCVFINSQSDGVTIAWGDFVNKNISINRCKFLGNGNGRNGVSVIQCENVTIKDCYFDNTTKEGMPGGIDIEPNNLVSNVIKNVVIENCRFDNITSGTAPICYYSPANAIPADSIRISNCIVNCSSTYPIYIGVLNTSKKPNILIENLTFNDNEYSSKTIYLSNSNVTIRNSMLIGFYGLRCKNVLLNLSNVILNKMAVLCASDTDVTTILANNLIINFADTTSGVLISSIEGGSTNGIIEHINSNKAFICANSSVIINDTNNAGNGSCGAFYKNSFQAKGLLAENSYGDAEGVYMYRTNITVSGVTANNCLVFGYNSSANNAVQIAFSVGRGLYTRLKAEGAWQAWKKISAT